MEGSPGRSATAALEPAKSRKTNPQSVFSAAVTQFAKAITVTAQTSMLHIRVDDDIKGQATQTLTAMGMSVSDAVRPFYVC